MIDTCPNRNCIDSKSQNAGPQCLQPSPFSLQSSDLCFVRINLDLCLKTKSKKSLNISNACEKGFRFYSNKIVINNNNNNEIERKSGRKKKVRKRESTKERKKEKKKGRKKERHTQTITQTHTHRHKEEEKEEEAAMEEKRER